MQIVDAAREADSLLEYSDKTVRWLRSSFLTRKSWMSGNEESMRG